MHPRVSHRLSLIISSHIWSYILTNFWLCLVILKKILDKSTLFILVGKIFDHFRNISYYIYSTRKNGKKFDEITAEKHFRGIKTYSNSCLWLCIKAAIFLLLTCFRRSKYFRRSDILNSINDYRENKICILWDKLKIKFIYTHSGFSSCRNIRLMTDAPLPNIYRKRFQ